MSTVHNNVVEFPMESGDLSSQHPNTKRAVIVVSDVDRDETILRYILDDTGQLPTDVWVSKIKGLPETLKKGRGDIVLIRDRMMPLDPQRLQSVLGKLAKRVPVLIISDEINEESTGKYLAAGARDVISLEHPKHVQSVIAREHGVVQLQRALGQAQQLSTNYESQVIRLTQASEHGIADVQDGSIVGANVAWTKLFSCKDSKQLLNTPILDLIESEHQPKLKKIMTERLDSKRRGSAVKVSGRRADGTNVPLEIKMERIRVAGALTLRFTASRDSSASTETASGLDPSTLVYGREYFVDQLEKNLSTPLPGGVRALALLRLDRFSKVLDEVGVLESERVIAHIAGILRELAHPSDLYGRFAGTVFAVLISRGSMREVEAWVQHLNGQIEEHLFAHDGATVKLSCTAGICEVADANMDAGTILREAHDACHHGRLKGGGTVHLSASSQTARIKAKNDTNAAEKLQLALRNNRLRLVRNPVISLNDNDSKIRDAWVRLIDDNGKDVLPREFMPIAERHNLMVMIDRWVIAAAVAYCAKSQPDQVFVRLSQDSILDESLIEWLQPVIKESGAKSSQICFQTTETIAVQSLKQTAQQAKRLTGMGFKFALDQLGTTTETTQVFEYVPMHYVRIDGALMQGVARDKEIQSQVKELVAAARARGIHTVGDRIEDAVTMAAACGLGIEYAQGDQIWQEDIVLEDTYTTCTPSLKLDLAN